MICDDGTLELVIDLEPVVASRPRVAGRRTYYLPKYATWKEAALAILEATTADGPRVGDSPVKVAIEAICTRPKRPANAWPVGDVDNYAKAALDVVTKAGVWDDDSQVVFASSEKRYAKPGELARTIIRITPLDEVN